MVDGGRASVCHTDRMNRLRWIAPIVVGLAIVAATAFAGVESQAATPTRLTCPAGWQIDKANQQCDGPINTLPDGYVVEQVTGPGNATMVTWENAAGTITGCSGLDEKDKPFTC